MLSFLTVFKVDTFLKCGFLSALFCFASFTAAFSFESEAPYAFLYDMDTKTVLYEKSADEPVEPGSMAKLLTLAVLFDLEKQKKISPDQMFLISENAWRNGGAPSGGTTMYANLKSEVSYSDLIKGIMVMSANDACIALAEGIDGSEQAFAKRLNAYAKKIGLEKSHFVNSTGLEQEGEIVTAREMVKLAVHFLEQFPQKYPQFAQADSTWNKIFQRNKNDLLRRVIGVDGFKTGSTDKSGYGAIGSVIRNGRRIVFFVHGLDTSEGRLQEAERLIDYAYNDFKLVELAASGEAIASAKVFGGEKGDVGLSGKFGAVKVLLPQQGLGRVKARVEYTGPVEAPVKKGMDLGVLIVERDGNIIQETPLISSEDVAEGTLKSKALDSLSELLFGWITRIPLPTI